MDFNINLHYRSLLWEDVLFETFNEVGPSSKVKVPAQPQWFITIAFDMINSLPNGKILDQSNLIDWLNGILCCFQQYFSHLTATAHIIHVFPGFHQYLAGLWSVLPTDTPWKKPRGSSVAQTQDRWITSQTLYHGAMWDPLSNLKAFADNKKDVTEKLKFVFGRVENIVGKGENAAFSPFLTIFSERSSLRAVSPARVAQWWACRTHDLVVVSSIPGWGDFPFWRIFTSHLCRSMWEKWSVALERKVVLVLVWENQETRVSPTAMIWP